MACLCDSHRSNAIHAALFPSVLAKTELSHGSYSGVGQAGFCLCCSFVDLILLSLVQSFIQPPPSPTQTQTDIVSNSQGHNLKMSQLLNATWEILGDDNYPASTQLLLSEINKHRMRRPLVVNHPISSPADVCVFHVPGVSVWAQAPPPQCHTKMWNLYPLIYRVAWNPDVNHNRKQTLQTPGLL